MSNRWEEFVSNPFVLTLAETYGINTQYDTNVTDLIKRYTRKETTFAYTPVDGEREGRWLFATWLGKDALTLRLKFALGLVRGFTRVRGNISNMQYWETTANEHSRLYLAITHGILIGCLSDNSDLIDYILKLEQYGVQTIPELKKGIHSDKAPVKVRDFMWIILPSLGQSSVKQLIKISFTDFTSTKMRGRIETSGIDTSIVKIPETDLNSILSSARSIIGTNMCLIASIPTSFISMLNKIPKTPKIIQFLYKLFESNIAPNTHIWISILDSRYKGRLFGMTIPVVLAGGVKSETKRDFLEETTAQIDRLNAELKCSFIPTSSSIQNTQVITLNQVTRGLFDSFTETSKPSIFTSEKYYILATDQKALVGLLEKNNYTETWWSEMIIQKNTVIYMASDMEKIQPVLTNLIDVLRIASMLQSGEIDVSVLLRLERAKRFFEIFKQFHTLRFWWCKDGYGELQLGGNTQNKLE